MKKEELANEQEIIIEMEIERLKDFTDHPFHVETDREMLQLKQSIEKYGVLSPLLVRPLPDGTYEIISGHRRKYAAKMLGYRKLPVLIRNMDDDDAVIAMVDSNLQREHIAPSEKAHAYKMKYDAIKRTAGRKNRSQKDQSLKGKRTVDIIGKQLGDSPKQVQRYLKITELVPEMQKRLDEGLVSFNPAVEIAFLKPDEQRKMMDAMDYTQSSPSLSQAIRIKKLSQEGKITLEIMRDILGEVKKGEVDRVIFKNEQLYRYFPRNYSAERMKREILAVLKSWMEQYWEQ